MSRARTRWLLPCGAVILKYRMTTACIEYLRYELGQPLEYGDYTSHKTLKEAKSHDSK